MVVAFDRLYLLFDRPPQKMVLIKFVHLPDSSAMISCPFGIIVFALQHAKFQTSSSVGINLNIVELSFSCRRRAVVLFNKDIGLPESAIANMR